MRARRRSAVAVALAGGALLAAGAAMAGGLVDPPPHIGPCGFEPNVYQLPGTDGCLRISGFVRAESGAFSAPAARFSGWAPASVSTGFGTSALTAPGLARSAIGAGARLSADVRIPTDYGPARIFVSLRGGNGVLASRR